MPYQRAISTLGCPALSLQESLELAARFGLDGIELRAALGTIDLPGYLVHAYGSPSVLAEQMRTQRVKVLAMDASFKLIGHKPPDREALLELVPWAEALGGLPIRVFDGCGDGNEAEKAADVMAWWQEKRSKNAWRSDLMVETHDAFLTAKTLEEFLRRAPGSKILWDAHNTWKKGGEDPLTTWPAIRCHTSHIHLKDSVGVAGEPDGYAYVLPGEGTFPAKELIATLKREFRGVVCLEWERLWIPGLAPLDQVLAVARRDNWW